MHPSSLLEVMHRRSIDSLDPLSASVPIAMADIWSVLALFPHPPPPPPLLFFFLFLPFSPLFFSVPLLLSAASKHLRLSHPVLNAGGVIKWMNKPAASSQTLPKYRIVSSAQTRPDILSELSATSVPFCTRLTRRF